MSEHLDTLQDVNTLDDIDGMDVVDVTATKRRLERIMVHCMPIPLAPDTETLCDALASKRVLEGIERERADQDKAHRAWKSWVLTPKPKKAAK